MPGNSRPSDQEIEEVNSNLAKGLETCRSMVANYREMISAELVSADNDDDARHAEKA